MHPARGLTYPAAFLPLAEETGLTALMGAWTLREACGQLKSWQNGPALGRDLWVSVNLSSRQLLQPDLTKVVAQTLSEAQINPSCLQLEVTEGIIMDDPEAATAVLIGLRSLGVRLPIDDFGTGYSSLAYLHRFPISSLKIDKSFVKNVDSGGEDEVIVRTIVNLAHNLDMDVIAEGVETEEQRISLKALGCEYGQGFLFSKAVPAEEATALLEGKVAVAA
jgi:EAL domain-containing protein (putative c-di-GMP-specific phosphodiesterase class I)